MKLNKNRRQQGFTLIELLITVAIISMLSVITVAGFRNGEKQKRIALAADGMVNLLRQGQNYALSGKQLPDNSGSTCPDSTPIGYAIGVYPSNNRLILLARDKCGGLITLETFNLPTGTKFRTTAPITITGCTPSCLQSPSFMGVVFYPPFAQLKIEFGVGQYTFNYTDLVIETVDGTRRKTVRLDGISGRIEVK